MDKNLFKSAPKGERAPPSTVVNEAGGVAYTLSSKQALARLAVTGCLSDVFYADPEQQLDAFERLGKEVDPVFLGQCALYSRKVGRMKDAPALLCAMLANSGAAGNIVLDRVFERVINNAKLFRNFFRIMRSGKLGRKSITGANRRRMQEWFSDRKPEQLFRESPGDPSMRDLLRTIHPKSNRGYPDPERSALYDYFLGKKDAENNEQLPEIVRQFETWKKSPDTTPTPDLPLQLLTGAAMSKAQTRFLWTQLSKTMSWWALRMNLATLARSGCFEDPGVMNAVAVRIADREEVRASKTFPYQILAAYKAAMTGAERLPNSVVLALHAALEHATHNMEELGAKRVVVAVDVSGSMESPVTGRRKGSTTSMVCSEVAALVAMCTVRRAADVRVVAFGQTLEEVRIDPAIPALKLAEDLGKKDLGGTDCSLPFVWLNQNKVDADLVILISDDQSWIDDRGISSTALGYVNAKKNVAGSPAKAQLEWNAYRAKRQDAKLVCLNLQPYETSQLVPAPHTLCIGGWSDSVFRVINRFLRGSFKTDAFVEEIESFDKN